MNPSHYSLFLTTQTVQVISLALQDAPYRVAAPALAEINSQIERQTRAKDEPPIPAPAAEEAAAEATD